MIKEDGFTLLEVLVALILAALLSSAVAAALFQIVRFSEYEQKHTFQSDLRSVVAHVRRIVSKSRNLPLLRAEEIEGHVFVGSTDAVQFVAVQRAGATRQKLLETKLSFVRDPEVFFLLQESWLRRLDDSVPILSRRLIDNLRSAKFEFGSNVDGLNGAFRWTSDWLDSHQLPAAVKMTIARDDDDEARPIVAVIPILQN